MVRYNNETNIDTKRCKLETIFDHVEIRGNCINLEKRRRIKSLKIANLFIYMYIYNEYSTNFESTQRFY